MNSFILDKDLCKNAEYHCDAHVVKLILEASQMVSTAYNLCNNEKLVGPYKTTHKNHPICIWTRSSINNYAWMAGYGLALCREYSHRYGKTHSCESKLYWLLTRIDQLTIPYSNLQSPNQAVPVELKEENSWDGAVIAYRNYYNKVKRYSMKTGLHWKNRNIPEWYANFR